MTCEKCHQPIVEEKEKRTSQQNRAMHLYFTLVAEELDAAGYDLRSAIKEGIPLKITPFAVKEYMWKPCQKQMFGKESTTTLSKKEEIDLVYDVMNRVIGERFGIHVDFPSIESLESET